MTLPKRRLFWIDNDDLIKAGLFLMESTGRCADSWTDSDLEYGRAYLASFDARHAAAPLSELRRAWTNLRKRNELVGPETPVEFQHELGLNQ